MPRQPRRAAVAPRDARCAVLARGSPWQGGRVTAQQEEPFEDWLTLSDAAEALGVSVSKVRQLARDHELAMVRRPGSREPEIPAAFLLDGVVVRGLPGTLTLLTDRGLTDAEAVDWLLTSDESLPGRPIDALRENRGREVRRRAQVII